MQQHQYAEKLKVLFSAMDARSEFPAMGNSVWRIVNAMDLDQDEFDLVQAILEDTELTHRVIAAANNSARPRASKVVNVTQAVVVLGYKMIGHLALGFKLDSALQALTQVHGAQAQRALYECSLAATIAKRLALRLYAPAAAEASVCGFLSRIGRVLLICYLPHIWKQVGQHMRHGLSEEEALKKVLNCTQANIGQAVALRWRLPSRFVESMNELKAPSDASEALSHTEWLNLIAQCAAYSAKRLSAGPVTEETLEALAQEWSPGFGMDAALFQETLADVVKEEEPRLSALPVENAGKESKGKAHDAEDMLARLLHVIQSQRKALPLQGLVKLTMEGLHRIFGPRRSVFMSKDLRRNQLVARQVLGEGEGLAGLLSIDCTFSPDAFQLSILKNTPLYITDATQLRKNRRLPESYLAHIKDDPNFLVIPLCVNKNALGLIYLDWAPDSEENFVSASEKALLVSIRDVLVAAVLDPVRPPLKEAA